MEILIKGRAGNKPAPKKRIKWCDECKSLLVVDCEDCYEAETILGCAAWAVDCPVCGKALNVGKR